MESLRKAHPVFRLRMLSIGTAFGLEDTNYSIEYHIVQNTAARLVVNAPRRTTSLPLLRQLHWLPVRQRVRFKVCCIVHKALHNNSPSYFAEKFTRYVPASTLRSGTQALLTVPRVRRARQGGKAFSHLAPSYWNKPPFQLRQCSDYLRFRKLLKTFLF